MESNSCMFSNCLHFLHRHKFSSSFSSKMHTITCLYFTHMYAYIVLMKLLYLLPVLYILLRLASCKAARSVSPGLRCSEL